MPLTKIGNLERGLVSTEQQVLGLEIAVADVIVVAVLETTQQLFEEVQCLLQRQTSVLDQVVEQFSALHVLQDQEPVCQIRKCLAECSAARDLQVLGGLVHFVEAQYIRMI